MKDKYIKVDIRHLTQKEIDKIIHTMTYRFRIGGHYIKVVYNEQSKTFLDIYKSKKEEYEQAVKGIKKLKELKIRL